MNEHEIEQEIEQRIREIEKNSDKIVQMSKKDYIVAAAVTVMCFTIIIIGAFL